MRAVTALLAVSIVLAACGEAPGGAADASPPTPTTTANAPLATLERVQRIADSPGDTAPLVSAAAVLPLPNGGLLVADSASRRVRRFTREGLAVATLGMPGVGPGQFQNVTALASSADTVFVWDLELSRVSAFDTTGTLIYTRRADPLEDGVPVDAAWAGEGAWLVLDLPIAAGASAQPQPAARLSRWSAATAWTQVVMSPAPPLTAPAVSAPDMARRWTARAAGDFWFSRTDFYAITHYNAGGDSLSSIVLGLETVPREIVATGEGELWARVDATADSVEWHTFDVFGALRFRVRLPTTLSLLAAAGDTVFAAGRNAGDAMFGVGRYVVRR